MVYLICLMSIPTSKTEVAALDELLEDGLEVFLARVDHLTLELLG